MTKKLFVDLAGCGTDSLLFVLTVIIIQANHYRILKDVQRRQPEYMLTHKQLYSLYVMSLSEDNIYRAMQFLYPGLELLH